MIEATYSARNPDAVDVARLAETWSQEQHLRLAIAARTAVPIFRNFGWTWRRDEDDVPYIPTEFEIQDTLYELAAMLETGHSDHVESGRFIVRRGEDGIEFTLSLA